ncbi:hypothetical protein DICVIV_00379 [Dictyocaulus viviparus]|uniref:Receptor expression-enhancing protein n=1 Tax=Dictyocaulus viviparus TaxID=29172 RepID=A0A0D8YFL8_DICVI|nr:hypothetical protein DICVIV_00379 [Dictyocaulus viviparus]
MPKDVLRPVAMKYTADSPVEKTPSFMERLQAIISPTQNTTSQIVKVRLINSWQDVTFDKINIVICNYLYDRKSGNHQVWKELERVTKLRRENLFYGMWCVGLALIIHNDSLTTLYCMLVLVFPAICSIIVLSSEDMHGVQFWLQYWTVYGMITSIGKSLKRSSHEASDTSWIEIVFFAACLLPGTYLLDFIFSCITPVFNTLRLKFEEYNYHYVS